MKSKRTLARKIACGILAISAVSVGGSVFAADYTDPITTGTYDDETFTMTVKNKSYPIDVDKAGHPITITSKYITITSTGDANRQLVAADAWSGDKLTLGGADTQTIKVTVNNSYPKLGKNSEGNQLQTLGLVSNGSGSDVEVKAKDFSLSVTGDHAVAINVGNNTQDPIAPSNAAKMSITADKVDITSSGSGLAIYSNGQFTMNGDVTINAKENAIEVRGNSTANINVDGTHKTVINGDIDFGTPNQKGGDGHNSGNIIDATLNINFVGEGSVLNGKAYQELGEDQSIEIDTNRDYYGDAKGLNMTFSDGAVWNMTGDSFVNKAIVKDGAAINVSADVKTVNIENMDMDNAALNLQGADQKINVVKVLSGEGTVNTSSVNNKVAVFNNSTFPSKKSTV